MNINHPIQRIYLVGIMGCGKTTNGSLLAQVLDWEFMDLDALIEGENGSTVSRIFSIHGETRFRDLETAALEQTLTLHNTVVACGGGVVLRYGNRETLKGECVIWLDVPPAEAAGRIRSRENRPLLQKDASILDILTEHYQYRYPLYAEVTDFHLKPEGESPEVVTTQILKFLEQNAHEH